MGRTILTIVGVVLAVWLLTSVIGAILSMLKLFFFIGFVAVLVAAGVGHGDRVAILDKNSLEYAELLFGAARLGAVQVPVNYRLAPDEVAYIVNDARAKVFVVGPEFVPVLDAIAGKLEHVP